MNTARIERNFTTEADRLRSFERWPIPHVVTPEDLAKAGFYFSKPDNKARCAACNGVVAKWEAGDDADQVHKRLFPLCSFVQHVIQPRLDNSQTAPPPVETDRASSSNDLSKTACAACYNNNYVTFESRLKSFEMWPKTLAQSPKVLAETGFYYLRDGDAVECFSCGGGLKDWEPQDDPWAEHARAFPKCNHVLLAKGREFIEKCAASANSHSTFLQPAHSKMVTAYEQFNSSYFNKPSHYEEPDNGILPMHKEANRLKTYKNWPCAFIEPRSLAKAGFYYVNKDDIVRCAFCQIEIGQWQQGDDAMADHQRWSDSCPFVRNRSCGNVPLEVDAVPMTSSPVGQDTCGKYGIEIRPNSLPETGATSAHSKEFDFRKLGLPPYRGPVYTDYVTLERRLSSFAGWPRSIKQKPNELAAAGFFYTGKGDQTICFHCGGGLKDWEDDDVPWEQHAKWFSKCNFVWLQKGPEYISEVCSKQQAVLTPDEAASLEVPSAHNKQNAKVAAVQSKEDTNGSACSQAALTSIIKPKENETKELVSEEDDESSSKNLCKICYAKERSVLFFPCLHMIACIDCAPALSICVVCREPFQAVTRVFLP